MLQNIYFFTPLLSKHTDCFGMRLLSFDTSVSEICATCTVKTLHKKFITREDERGAKEKVTKKLEVFFCQNLPFLSIWI